MRATEKIANYFVFFTNDAGIGLRAECRSCTWSYTDEAVSPARVPGGFMSATVAHLVESHGAKWPR